MRCVQCTHAACLLRTSARQSSHPTPCPVSPCAPLPSTMLPALPLAARRRSTARTSMSSLPRSASLWAVSAKKHESTLSPPTCLVLSIPSAVPLLHKQPLPCQPAMLSCTFSLLPQTIRTLDGRAARLILRSCFQPCTDAGHPRPGLLFPSITHGRMRVSFCC